MALLLWEGLLVIRVVAVLEEVHRLHAAREIGDRVTGRVVVLREADEQQRDLLDLAHVEPVRRQDVLELAVLTERIDITTPRRGRRRWRRRGRLGGGRRSRRRLLALDLALRLGRTLGAARLEAKRIALVVDE